MPWQVGIRIQFILAVAAVTGLTLVNTGLDRPESVQAASSNGITAYISPPFVQGPPTNTNSIIEDFNVADFCASLGASPVGTFSGTCTSVSPTVNTTEQKWGGANTTSDQPTFGGTASPFVGAFQGQALTLTFPVATPAKYIGFWWSAGNAGNKVDFYSQVNGSEVLVATFTTNTLNELLNTSGTQQSTVLPPNPYPGNQFLTALDGTQYNKGHYFGRPSDHSSLDPSALPVPNSASNNIYSHAYLNVYASGSIAFSKVVFTATVGGFELDNVAVSDQERIPTPKLVLLQSVLGKSVEYRANGGTGSMPAQTSTTASTLTQNSFTRDGFTFAGWSTSPSGSIEFPDGASFNFATDLTLHAIWTAIPSAPTSTSTSTTTAPTTTTPNGAPTDTSTTIAPTTTTVPESVEGLEAEVLPVAGSTHVPTWLFGGCLVVTGWMALRSRRYLLA